MTASSHQCRSTGDAICSVVAMAAGEARSAIATAQRPSPIGAIGRVDRTGNAKGSDLTPALGIGSSGGTCCHRWCMIATPTPYADDDRHRPDAPVPADTQPRRRTVAELEMRERVALSLLLRPDRAESRSR